ncbi:hypothetical protein PTSG_09478 [Salpingoeca rosetta]|uniref:Uncharacterized protein n=1 Tax=Salpingoeca rosetta (strain ATCC 50818 / BSB-021) TaxID=946362 RepID=F2UL46_SALR5|nr:uncharacterized protein PTSG_09478 [Salpingoeca rosetta]EGD77845.1 hypothetical protein PTSG_09478 [Salpingoeca rosetta]|eukprot:XP_004989909.1 hypothetical protein PTSG_09478 [Salpingoeca rosetta]
MESQRRRGPPQPSMHQQPSKEALVSASRLLDLSGDDASGRNSWLFASQPPGHDGGPSTHSQHHHMRREAPASSLAAPNELALSVLRRHLQGTEQQQQQQRQRQQQRQQQHWQQHTEHKQPRQQTQHRKKNEAQALAEEIAAQLPSNADPNTTFEIHEAPAKALDIPVTQRVFHDLPSIQQQPEAAKPTEYAKPKKYRNTKPRVRQSSQLTCQPIEDIDLSFRSFDLIPPPHRTTAARAPPPTDRSFERATFLSRHGVE